MVQSLSKRVWQFFKKLNLVGRGKLGVWDEHMQTTIYKINNQQGPTV